MRGFWEGKKRETHAEAVIIHHHLKMVRSQLRAGRTLKMAW